MSTAVKNIIRERTTDLVRLEGKMLLLQVL